MSNPLVLITGVTGFLAQHVVAATLQAGYRVRGYVNSSAFKYVSLSICT
jgi:nucleoside-diphosphate-sugar epimerase